MDIGKLFSQNVWNQGQQYVNENRVVVLEATEHLIRARVEEEHVEAVRIELEKDRIQSLYCSCSKAKQGKHCAHMASVFEASMQQSHPYPFEFENFSSEDDTVDLDSILPEPLDPEVIQELGRMLALVSHDGLIEYLIYLFETRPDLVEDFLDFDFSEDFEEQS